MRGGAQPTPLAASWDAWRGMRGLSERPLGSMLYDDPDVWRSPFEVTRLTAGSALFLMANAVARDAGATSPGLWARRSLFWRRDQPLLVAECFLPGFWVLSARRAATRETDRLLKQFALDAKCDQFLVGLRPACAWPISSGR